MPARNGQQSVVYLIGSILGGYTAISKRRTTCQATGGNGTSGKATGQGARVVTVGSQRASGGARGPRAPRESPSPLFGGPRSPGHRVLRAPLLRMLLVP